MSVVLCLNSGSSSLKFGLYDMAVGEQCLESGAIERLAGSDTAGAVRTALERLRHFPPPSAVGHRVVFGGARHTAPAIIDDALLADLRELGRFAPLHMPAALAAIEEARRETPSRPHVACFDTAFHRGLPEVAQRFALPRALWDEGVRRFGFHGLSYEYVVSTIGAEPLGRAVIAHLGHGVSLAAVHHGRPIDTTMGFTPAAGVMMSTRSGDVDPGVLVYLMREKGLDAGAVERLCTRQSGLLGVSGLSGDVQDLLARRHDDSNAATAIEMFCYQLRKQIGALAAALGGLDTLVFTGGIGERSSAIRSEVSRGLEHLDIHIDEALNERHAPVISVSGRCVARVVATDENLMIARHTHELTKGAA